MLEKKKKDIQMMLSARKTIESEKRKAFKRKHLYSTEKVYHDVEMSEKATKKRIIKRRKSITTLVINSPQNQRESSQRIEIFDSITVEQNID